MNNDQRDIRRKLRLLEYAKKIGDVSKACRYFGTVKGKSNTVFASILRRSLEQILLHFSEA